METTKKITRATFKSFIRKNDGNLFINVKSEFDGMTDCCESRGRGFSRATWTPNNNDMNLGISGVWLVGSSRDWFKAYSDDRFTGIEVSNCCGHFIVAVEK